MLAQMAGPKKKSGSRLPQSKNSFLQTELYQRIKKSQEKVGQRFIEMAPITNP
jgi:hypothetical protein